MGLKYLTRVNLLIFILFGEMANAQQDAWPATYSARWAQIAPIIQGEIVTESNDTIRGLIKQIPGEFPILHFGKNEVLEIKRDNISKVRLDGHSMIKDSYTTEIVNLGRRGFWRVLCGDKNMGIFDNVFTAPTFVYGSNDDPNRKQKEEKNIYCIFVHIAQREYAADTEKIH